MRTRWTVRIEELPTRLALGQRGAHGELEPVCVSLVVNGFAPDSPEGREEVLDLDGVCQWITHDWPQTAATPVLEHRVNELLAQVFGTDRRVQDAWVGLYRLGSPDGPRRVGVERHVSRLQFQSHTAARVRT